MQKKVSISSIVALIAAGVGIWTQSGPISAPHAPREPGTQSRSERIPFIASAAKTMPPDSPVSAHPAEALVAGGQVLDTRIQADTAGHWIRTRLVRTPAHPRLVRVIEHWRDENGSAVCLNRDMFLADQLLVRTAPDVGVEALRASLAPADMRVGRRITDNLWSVTLPAADLDAVPNALTYIATRPEIIAHAEADGVGFGAGTPNDSFFSLQWSLHNTGQSGGTPAIDVNAFPFWEMIENAPGVTIAVIDSGLNFTHPDLQGIAWTNSAEVPNDGVDNDANGKIDDVTGWDFVNGDNNPSDDEGHGSHVTGIMAANRNNGIGIAGLISGARILVCKVLNSSNIGFTSDLIEAVAYARTHGAPIMNLSLQLYPVSELLEQEFDACESAGILLVICAGNQGVNNDTVPNYPSSYSHGNIIAVANHTRTNKRAVDSNYGGQSVDLFAPGASIYSTVLGQNYANYSGTSMATPHVTAVCAAIKYANPSWTAADIKNAVLMSVTHAPAYDTWCLTGGRLDASAALDFSLRANPAQDPDGDGFHNLVEYLARTRIDSAFQQPTVSTEMSDGRLMISMPRIVRPDAYLEVEQSTDLVTWTTTGVTDASTPETLLGSVSLLNQPTVFLRIRATASGL